MGRLLIFVGILVIAAIVIGVCWMLLSNQQERSKMGLTGSKRKMAELQARADRYRGTLTEIQEIANVNVATGIMDPLWDLVLSKTNDALDDNDREK